LVVNETPHSEFYTRLLEKLEVERDALGGQVFDVLGRLTFQNRPLRELLVEAIRYGDQPEVRARLKQAVEAALDREHLRDLLEERALVHDAMDASKVRAIREELERAEARRLQPFFIASFFLEAFRQLGGTARERERGRYELTHVPAVLRGGDGASRREPILPRYERVTFEKALINVPGKPLAEFLAPGHPLLQAVIALLMMRAGDLMQRGAMLIDPADLGETPRVLVSIEHVVHDARPNRDGGRHAVSRRLQFVEIASDGAINPAGYAPYLDYRPPTGAERAVLATVPENAGLRSDLEQQALEYAITHLVPEHIAEVRQRTETRVTKTLVAVQERLTKEVIYWNNQAVKYRAQEQAGKTPRMNAAVAERRADELQDRLRRRVEELEQERKLAPQPPVIAGGALIVPAGLLVRLLGTAPTTPDGTSPEARRRVDVAAVAAVMAAERALGFEPRDVSALKVGYDVESRIVGTGKLRFIEVKGRSAGAETVEVTRNEILTALNKPDDFILALVEVGEALVVRYVRRPFTREPEAFEAGIICRWNEMWSRGKEPSE
jgi:hypothetical protein